MPKAITISLAAGLIMWFATACTTRFVTPFVFIHIAELAWYASMPVCALLCGFILGGVAGFGWSLAKTHRTLAGAISMLGGGLVILWLSLWLLYFLLNNILVENYKSGPLNTTYHYLPYALIWYCCLYGIPTIWAVGLILWGHKATNR